MEKAEAEAAQAVQEYPVVAVSDCQSVIVNAECRAILATRTEDVRERSPL
jgi:hypothetical protein